MLFNRPRSISISGASIYLFMSTKSESFASCRNRVNISGGSKIASITVECNGDSLSVTVPLKVKKCLRACVTPVISP